MPSKYFYHNETMALNPSSQAPSAVDVIDGTVSEFYNIMDQCIRRSEVMPGQYKSITSPSYSNNCPIDESSFTTVDVGCPAPQVVDVNNSFITAIVEVPITFPAGFKAMNNINTFFVGWRSSLDILQRYIIYCNHKVVYDQVYVGEESYILQSLIPEHVRCRKPNQYTTYENASTMSPDVCGTYITINAAANSESDPVALANPTTINVKIPIKLDINQFLLFQNFKYLPGFCGTWSIKLYPSTQNMIVCPVDPRYCVSPDKLALLSNLAGSSTGTIDSYTHNFVQMGDKFTCLKEVKFAAPTYTTDPHLTKATVDSESVVTNVAPTTTIAYTSEIKIDDNMVLTAGRAKVHEVLYHQTQFELMYDIYDGLKARYMARPLTIPVNKLDYGRFAGGMSNGQSSSTYTAAVSNVESIFILPFTDDMHHTVCFNPEFKEFYLSISGFGNYPQQPLNTCGNDEKHVRFVNMTLDALNINNSPIMAPNKDLMNSIETKKVMSYAVNAAGTFDDAHGNAIDPTFATPKYDTSNFLIGIPFSNDIDFQGGLTSNGNINIKLAATSSTINTLSNSLRGVNCQIGATVMFCCDCALMLKVIPYSDQPEVRLVTERIV